MEDNCLKDLHVGTDYCFKLEDSQLRVAASFASPNCSQRSALIILEMGIAKWPRTVTILPASKDEMSKQFKCFWSCPKFHTKRNFVHNTKVFRLMQLYEHGQWACSNETALQVLTFFKEALIWSLLFRVTKNQEFKSWLFRISEKFRRILVSVFSFKTLYCRKK